MIERDASQLFATSELYGEEAEVVPEARLAKYAAATGRVPRRQTPRFDSRDAGFGGQAGDLLEL